MPSHHLPPTFRHPHQALSLYVKHRQLEDRSTTLNQLFHSLLAAQAQVCPRSRYSPRTASRNAASCGCCWKQSPGGTADVVDRLSPRPPSRTATSHAALSCPIIALLSVDAPIVTHLAGDRLCSPHLPSRSHPRGRELMSGPLSVSQEQMVNPPCICTLGAPFLSLKNSNTASRSLSRYSGVL